MADVCHMVYSVCYWSQLEIIQFLFATQSHCIKQLFPVGSPVCFLGKNEVFLLGEVTNVIGEYN